MMVPENAKPGSWLSPVQIQESNEPLPGTPPPTLPPDGRLIVTSMSGVPHEYPYADMKNGWRPTMSYLSVSTLTGRVNWPWHAILNFETISNSREYTQARERLSAWENARRAAQDAGSSEGCGDATRTDGD